ncbi:MAG: mechanosensitive ion channel domain-containing protein, partial [Prolixibacteraceae bacterium]
MKSLFAIGLLFISVTLSAQKDSVHLNNDSINAALLRNYSQKLAEIEQQRIADSIQKADLEHQLMLVKTTDRLKKEDLQKQLQELNSKERLQLERKMAEIDSLRSTARGFPVMGFFKDTLFLIYSKTGSFSAKERAHAISNRIHELSDIVGFKPDTIKLSETEYSVDLVCADRIIMSVSENDALWNNTAKTELAAKYLVVISTAVSRYKNEISLMQLSKEIALAIFVLVIIFLLIFYTNKLFRWTGLQIQSQEEKRIKGLKIRNYTLFDAQRQVKVLLNINLMIKWFVILIIIYFALPVLFGIFPWTKNFAEVLFGYILSPIKKIAIGLWNYLPNLIAILIILGVFRYVLKGLKFLKEEIAKGDLSIPGFYPDWANPTYQIVRIMVYAFMIVVIFPYLPGSDSKVFQGVSVFLGFLFTFGSAGSLSNVIAGLVLTYMRLFKIGDRVKIGDVVGDVIEKSLLVTRIRTIKNEIISIPNSTVMNSHTINYSSDAPDKGLIIHTTVTIGYDVPWRDMHQALIDAALKTELIL